MSSVRVLEIADDLLVLQRGDQIVRCEGCDIFEQFEDTDEMIGEFDYLVELAELDFSGVTLV